ncbi:YbcC family protein [Sulfobacillus thermosulfidooxidans]|uniref:YbcC family protein n=1 Tax=Sulfobacillus thermosulfidooxidans TaxID=28034 RepID=UPI0002DCACE6|nr:DUF2309 domain-containing protein [Sulfobacillus thermosulfidooxidans]
MMTVTDWDVSQLRDKVERACKRIAPLWPLKSFVAVNPYMGLTHQSFWEAHATLERIGGTGLCMPRTYYWQQLKNGRITHKDLRAALREWGCVRDVSSLEQEITQNRPGAQMPFALFTDILGHAEGQDWSGFVVERISQYCAAYFDEGQALWPFPWSDQSLYQGWIHFMRYDKSPGIWGVRGLREAIGAWPDSAEGAIVQAVRDLDVPWQAVDDYLYAALWSVGGWAGWTRYRLWQAELRGDDDGALRDLLAIRLSWDALLYKLQPRETGKRQWREWMVKVSEPPIPPETAIPVDVIFQTALEIGYQRQLPGLLNGPSRLPNTQGNPVAQAVFCIDVRSEIFRRALETVAPGMQTLGFAGFFGIPMAYLRFGDLEPQAHLPVLFTPAYCVSEGFDHQQNPTVIEKMRIRRHLTVHLAKTWKMFKTSASSTFAFVEAVGMLWAPKLIGDSLGWTRPVPHPDRVGIPGTMHRRLQPVLSHRERSIWSGHHNCTGIPESDRPAIAASVLRNMGLITDFARVVLLVGHRSSTVNNPQATALDCGACGGQSGEASARVAAALLNDAPTRRALKQQGIDIPDETYFLAGVHDTVTDEVQLFHLDAVPLSHTGDVAQVVQWLTDAGQMARQERAILVDRGDRSRSVVHAKIRQRAQDWAEVRPEWALARNAAFVAAPRSRTWQRDLAGRVFLHDYDWRRDPSFHRLELIMTAPMIVAHWINMQYYGSMVDPRRLGSGNKVLHNVVGGSIGVFEGNGGDLRVGLAWQSLHDGIEWVHEPLRLNVLIEAPQDAIEMVMAHHETVRILVENGWIHLFQIADDGYLHRWGWDKQWHRDEITGS